MFQYEGTLYRPPSEARSLIVQVTIGCAHNACGFCNMYKQKAFRIRKEEEILAELDLAAASPYRDYYEKMFFADGDALCVPTDRLVRLLAAVQQRFPKIKRVTAYATAADVLKKPAHELKSLRQAGLQMVYMGAESGDDDILQDINKGCTTESYIKAAGRLHEAGIKNSVTLISGLGGRERLSRHAVSSAGLISAMKPEYCSFLTLRLFPGTPMYDQVKSGRFTCISDREVLEEMLLFLDAVDSEGTIFRSNHASNYLPLAGTLNEDIPVMREAVLQAMEFGYDRPGRAYRGL